MIAQNQQHPEGIFPLKPYINKMVADEETRLIGEALHKTHWNRRMAADLLQISYRSLLYKIKGYGLDAVQL